MTLCALTDADITRVINDKLKTFGGVMSLKATLALLSELPNFDTFDKFIKSVIEDIQPGTTEDKVVEKLKTYTNLIIGNAGIIVDNYLKEKVHSFWSSSPKIIDTVNTDVINSSNPNVTDTSDNNKKSEKLGIDKFYTNINHINEFINNFKNNVNEQLFMYRNIRGKVIEVNNNSQLNEAIKILKNKIAQDLVIYLQNRNINDLLDPNIYDVNTFEYNESNFKKLIDVAEKTIKSDNYFLNESDDTRLAFNNLEMLRRFDKYVELYLPDSISIVKGYSNSIFEPEDGIKYRKANKMHVDKHYGNENDSDIFNHTNESMRIFIESIPYHDSFSGISKRISMNMFNTIFAKLNESYAYAMAEMRIIPEEKFMKILEDAMNNPDEALKDSIYLTNQLEGIYNKIKDLYELLKNTRFGNNLYSMITSYVNKLTTINYSKLSWDRNNKRYQTDKLTNKETTRISSDLEKQFQTASKYRDFNLQDKATFSFSDRTYTITTNKAEYIIPFDGTDMIIKVNNNTLLKTSEVFNFIMNEDFEFQNIMNKVFANKIDQEVLNIAYKSYNDKFMRIFNLMGNILLNNEFSQGTKLISGSNKVARNLEYFNTDEVGSQYKSFIETIIQLDLTENAKVDDVLKRIYNPVLGTLRVAGFNKGDIGRNVIYNAIADSNGDSVRSYVVGESGNMLSLTRLPNIINADKVLFNQLYEKEGDPFKHHNIFSEMFNIAKDTLLKTTITNKEGTVASISSLSVSDLLTSLIISDYFGDPNTIYVQPVTYADKSQVWLKGISRNDKFTYDEVEYKSGLGGASIDQLLKLHYKTMSAMMNHMHNNIVKDFNLLYSYMMPEVSVSSYEEAIFALLNNGKSTNDIYTAVKRALKDGHNIEIYPEIHYCSTKSGLQANETLLRSIELYNNFNKFKENQNSEKKLWAYIAAKEGLQIEYTFTNGNNNTIIGRFGKDINNYENDWVNKDTGELILSKIKNKQGKYLDEININNKKYDTSHHSALDAIKFNTNYEVELNPEIDKFFEINALVTNNYIAATVGMPFIHPAKTTFDNEYKKLSEKGEIHPSELTETTIRKMEAVRTSAHSKRMVIYGATIHPFIQLKFDGIPNNYNISCIADKITNVFNLQGGTEKQKQYDGGVWENPFIAIWEKNSLPELALSPIHRKSIAYFPISSYLASGLGKWATFSFNNEMIRNASSRNDVAISGHQFMKKMTNHKWIIPNLDVTNNGVIDYSGYYYYDEDLHHNVKITGLSKIKSVVNPDGSVDNIYELNRVIVNNDGSTNDEFTKIYDLQLNKSDHIINSNYDLWKTLGGEYSKSIKNNGIESFLDWSEDSIEKVAQSASEIAIRRTLKDDKFDLGYESYLSEIKELDENLYNSILEKLTRKFETNNDQVSFVTQSFYLQPMKHSDIHYVAPESAIKNGSANINPASGYNLENFELNSWVVSSLHIGIQLNADHHVDNSEISEMSQVISAMEQLGTTHSIANLAYKSIGLSVANNLKDLKLHIEGKSEEDNNKIYYILGKELCKSFTEGKGWDDISLANAYLGLVLKEFGPNYEFYKKQGNVKFKLPFDDPNIFDAFYNSFASSKNKEAIKRRYSGLQAVLTPSQDFNTLYDIDGKIVKYEDLLLDETKRDINTGARLYPNAKERLALADKMVDVHDIEAGDYVELDEKPYMVQGFTGDRKNGIVGLSYIRSLRGEKIKKLSSYGRNLKNANHKFVISDEDSSKIIGGFKNFDIWDLDSAKLAHNLEELLLWVVEDSSGLLYLDTSGSNTLKLEDRKKFYSVKAQEPNPMFPEKLNQLYLIYSEVRQRSIGKWKKDHFTGDHSNDLKYINDVIQSDLDMIDGNKEFIIPVHLRSNPNERIAKIENITYVPYEVMIGATQASSFGLKPGDSIQDILELKEKFFFNRFSENLKTLAEDYDAYLVHPHGDHLHVLLSDNVNTDRILKKLNANELDIITEQEGEIVYRVINGKRVYSIDENTKWYQIPLGNNQVYEFVVVKSSDELKGILSSNVYDRVINNTRITGKDIALNASRTELSNKERLILNLIKMSPNTNQIKRAEINKITTAERYLNFITKQIDKDILLENASKRYLSFLQYLDFIVARIPAQSMQSFMNMRIAGFINTPTNSALVPATLFWLQGSDLDIDKAFMLGSSISDSGYYNDWSDTLFNYTSKETVDASNELPIPDGVIRTYTDKVDGGYGIDGTGLKINIFIDGYNNIINTNNILNLSLDNYLQETSNDPSKIKILSQLITRILDFDIKSVNLPQPLLELINSHTTLELDKFRLNEALKNKVWFLLKQTGENIRNFYSLMNPISLEAALIAAASSAEGKDSNIISLLNPATVMLLQLANSVGKDCIGISATGSKVAAAVILHFNEIARLANSDPKFIDKLKIPKKEYKIDGISNAIHSRPTLTNINWTNNLNLIKDPNKNSLYNIMLKEGATEDMMDRISVLISISTDNAKELILLKIGATKDLMSVYVYGILIGEEFSKIAEFMTKPEVSMVLKKSGKSLLNDSKKDMSLAKAISYYIEGVDTSSFELDEYLGGIDLKFKDNFSLTDNADKLRIKEISLKILEYHPELKEKTLDIVRFDDLIGGSVTDKYILELQKELINLIIKQTSSTLNLEFSKIKRAVNKESRYSEFVTEDFDYSQDYGDHYDDGTAELEDIQQSFRKKGVSPVSYLRYLNESKNRINDLLQFDNLEYIFDNITTLNSLKKDSESITLLGKFLSINQGIPTKQVDRINKITGIEKSIKGRFSKIEGLPGFNLMEFFTDSVKQQQWIDAYDTLNDPFNILFIVANSPHFSEMWKGFVTVQKASDAVAIKSWLTDELSKHLKDRGVITSLTQKDVSKIKNYISDLFVNKFLSLGLNNKTLDVPLNMKMIYDDSGILVPVYHGDKNDLDLSNTYDRMSFKYWFENDYLPEMEKLYPNNQFIKALGVTTYADDMGNPETVTRLPINMISNRDADKTALATYTNGFVEIKNIQLKIGGEYIGNDNYRYTNEEVFFLYNLLVNKNKFGESSLTKIFDSSIWEYKNNVGKKDNLIIDYFNFERSLIDDPNLKFDKEEDMNIDDLELRFATRGEKPNQYYFMYDESGIREYFNKYGESVEILPSALQLPLLLKVAKFRGAGTIKNISEKLKDLIYNNKLEIKFIECHG